MARPYTDLGNLLRFERDAGSRKRFSLGTAATMATWTPPDLALDLARAADLFASSTSPPATTTRRAATR